MTAGTDRLYAGIWHPNDRGVVRCAFQDCQAEPTPGKPRRRSQDTEARVRSRTAIDYARRAMTS